MYTLFSWAAKCVEVAELKPDLIPYRVTTPPSGPSAGTKPAALVEVEASVEASLATTFATTDDRQEEIQAFVLWRRRVLPPGPEGLRFGRYVRVRRFESRVRVGPPTGRPARQPSLNLAVEPEDAVRPQSPLNGHFPRSQAIPGVVVWSGF